MASNFASRELCPRHRPLKPHPTTTKCWHPHDINSLPPSPSPSLSQKQQITHRSLPDPRPNPQELLNERNNKHDFKLLIISEIILDKIEKEDLETGLEREREISSTSSKKRLKRRLVPLQRHIASPPGELGVEAKEQGDQVFV